MYNQEDLEALELFNAKADKLNKSTLIRFLCEQGGIGCKISWDKDERVTIERRWPDEDATEAFILTLRFFIQNNERSSVENMQETYDNLPISQEKKDLFKNAREKLNQFLDSNSSLAINDQFLTHRQILWTFIYGELAHANEKLKPVYDQWMSYGIFSAMIYAEFIRILAVFTSCIAYVQKLNEQVINELRKKQIVA